VLVGEAYGTQERDGGCIKDMGGGNLKERDYLENLGVDGRVILR